MDSAPGGSVPSCSWVSTAASRLAAAGDVTGITVRTSEGRSSTEVATSSGRSSLHRYDACTWPGTNHTRWSGVSASRSAAACRQ